MAGAEAKWGSRSRSDTPQAGRAIPQAKSRTVPPGRRSALWISDQARRHHASQWEPELLAAIEMVMAIDPKIIVEIGCDRGGSLYAWRQITSEVYGITLPVNLDSGGLPCIKYGAKVHYGDSHDESSLAWISDQLDGRPADVLILDGDHHIAGARRDLAMYGPLVRPGGLIMFHDISTHLAGVEVWQLWDVVRELFSTEEIRIMYGWGVVHVREGDDFTVPLTTV